MRGFSCGHLELFFSLYLRETSSGGHGAGEVSSIPESSPACQMWNVWVARWLTK